MAAIHQVQAISRQGQPTVLNGSHVVVVRPPIMAAVHACWEGLQAPGDASGARLQHMHGRLAEGELVEILGVGAVGRKQHETLHRGRAEGAKGAVERERDVRGPRRGVWSPDVMDTPPLARVALRGGLRPRAPTHC